MPLYKQQQGSRDNPTLVFLHGFLGNSCDWNDTINLLKDNFHCVTIDLPGHGASVALACPRSNAFNYCHGLIKDALDALNIESYTLIGYSLGGRIALDYARTQNDPRLKALILESSQIGLTDEHAKELRFMEDHGWAKKFATQNILDTLSEWYEQAVFSDLSDRKRELLIDKRSRNYGVPLANMLLATSLGKQQSALTFLQETQLPVYYCVGEKDKKYQKIGEQLIQLGTVKVTEFENVGHNIHQGSSKQFADFVAQQAKI